MSTAPDGTDVGVDVGSGDPWAVLAAVDRLLAAGGDRAGRRTAVRLLRLAVEQAVDRVWHVGGLPAMTRVSRRAQFLVLAHAARDDAARDAAREAAAAWAALSTGCHHHAYELTPTAAEVADLRTRTAGCLAALARADPATRPAAR